MEPQPQTRAQGEAVDSPPITEIAVHNPSILLMDSTPNLKFLLSRDTLTEPNAIHLHGVRLIEIPLGWRLALMRGMSRLFKIRLPDEREFNAIDVPTRRIPAMAMAQDTVVGQVVDPHLLIQLTGNEYFQLFAMNGRLLHRWLADRFDVGMGLRAGKPRINKTRWAA